MSTQESSPTDFLEDVMPAADGKGPLYQRDYWAVIAGCRTSPAGVMEILRAKFPDLAPAELAGFHKSQEDKTLELGDEMEVSIRGVGKAGVRIVHLDQCSLTIATLKGHPEAGRITFGSYRNPRGDVIFHIRSRARSSSTLRYAGFLMGGEPMQTSTWGELVNRLAASTGDGVIGAVEVETRTVEDDEGDRLITEPTFKANGD